jgi:hypothetical protein
VWVDAARIPGYAASLPLAMIQSPEIDPAYHFLGTTEETVAYVVTLDTINFGSGYFPALRKRPGLSGYFTVALALKEWFAAHGPLQATELARLAAGDCARIFGQQDAGPVAGELMELFAAALRDLGGFLLTRFEGRPTALVEAAGASAERLVALLDALPYFHDVQAYDELSVPFYKRAQLMAADLSVALAGQGPGRFDDLVRLTIFADNLVPHVLRVDGVLRYDDALAAAIDAGDLIPSGSREEVEIRAAAVHAVELMVAALRVAGHDVTARGLDYALWTRGGQPLYKARPRHRTRSIFY